MQYLSYEVCSTMNGNFAQFDKKAKLFGRKVRSFAKFFRLVMEGIRGLASQDLFVYLLLFYQSKFNYLLVAIAFVCSVGLFVRLIGMGGGF